MRILYSELNYGSVIKLSVSDTELSTLEWAAKMETNIENKRMWKETVVAKVVRYTEDVVPWWLGKSWVYWSWVVDKLSKSRSEYFPKCAALPRNQLFCELLIYLLISPPPWRCGPTRVMASSFLRFLDHSQWRTTVSEQLVAETSTWQHTTFTRDKYQVSRWDSNPQF